MVLQCLTGLSYSPDNRLKPHGRPALNLLLRLGWGVGTSLTQLYDGRDRYRIYYIKNNYMFRPFTFAIIRLRNEKKT